MEKCVYCSISFLTRVVMVVRPQAQAAQDFALSSVQQQESSKIIGQT